jgi:hypothetical protein
MDQGMDTSRKVASFANIYAKERANFWRWMVDELLEARWLVYGDFNMIDAQKNKKGMLLARIPLREKEAGYALKY